MTRAERDFRDAIASKRDGCALSTADYHALVSGLLDHSVSASQAAAMLMAITIQGMDADEAYALTIALRDSGRTLDLSGLPYPIDKHSTGGVGDKATLVVVPILAACGATVIKMSGGRLGMTGGTADKLASIPGLRTQFSTADALQQARAIGAVLMEQSTELTPGDGALYKLRDHTATVPCDGLIAASVMSKKLAAGASTIILDVKAGSGAFMVTPARARSLARLMIGIGARAGVRTIAVITDMNTPLGRCVGNALEVEESVRLLLDPAQADPRLARLCKYLAAEGLVASGRAGTRSAAAEMAAGALASGAAARKLAEVVRAQGGPPTLEGLLSALPRASMSRTVKMPGGSGTRPDAAAVGQIAFRLGIIWSGADAAVDPAAGVRIDRRPSHSDPIAELYSSVRTAREMDAIAHDFQLLLDRSVSRRPLIIDRLGALPEGVGAVPNGESRS